MSSHALGPTHRGQSSDQWPLHCRPRRRAEDGRRRHIALHGDAVDFDALQFEVAQEVDHLRLWEQHIAAIDRRVAALYHQLHPSNALRSIPGIGPILAPLLVATLGDATRFRNETHARAFCGMFPV